ncbi:MAG TPA: ABC transporter permease [Candidatus Elarobacter sp.]|jgi:putative ABC transport system permease protein|nr:ABC transporter permease [Candidatus Elarobacter sp.]
MIGRLRDYLGEAFAAIWRNRMRSILTMLGMIIGTSSIIAVLGLSHAASGGITDTLNAFGDQGISVDPDPNQDDPQSAAIQYRDVRAVEDAAGNLFVHIEPSYQRNLLMRVGKATSTSIALSAGDYHNDALVMREGRRLATADVDSGAHVCDVTGPLADKLFKTGPALGGTIEFNGTRCTVVGVFAEIKGGLFNSAGGNEILFLPYTTFHDIAPGPIDSLSLWSAPGVTMAQVTEAVDGVLQRLHGPRAQYVVSNNQAFIQSFNSVLQIVALGLTGIGGVALLVAGIGIMNIMLVSVTERTREIGLRKAIGARAGDVALQFLLEAILLSFIGGGIGMLLGLGATLAAYGAVESLVGPAPIPWLLIMSVAVGFSAVVGCVFGTYPAIRAARLDPIAALRS